MKNKLLHPKFTNIMLGLLVFLIGISFSIAAPQDSAQLTSFEKKVLNYFSPEESVAIPIFGEYTCDIFLGPTSAPFSELKSRTKVYYKTTEWLWAKAKNRPALVMQASGPVAKAMARDLRFLGVDVFLVQNLSPENLSLLLKKLLERNNQVVLVSSALHQAQGLYDLAPSLIREHIVVNQLTTQDILPALTAKMPEVAEKIEADIKLRTQIYESHFLGGYM